MDHRNSKTAYLTTWAEIDLKALAHNFNLARRMTGGKEIIPIIKANGYGHGAKEIARYLSDKMKVKRFGVARVSEGVLLRKQGIKTAAVIILNGFTRGEAPEVVKYNLEPSVFSKAEALVLNNIAKKTGKKINVHLKINTGMNRLGIRPELALEFTGFLRSLSNINLTGVYTHFANADMENPASTLKQALLLHKIRAKAGDVLFHAANSAAIMKYAFSHFDAVRPGIMLYGSYADSKLKNLYGLKPVMTLKSRIISTGYLKAGEQVSYGGLYKAKKKENIAIVGIGYGDGFRRDLTGRGWYVMVKGKKMAVIGRVCMDMIAIKTKGSVKIGDEVLIFGKNKYGEIKVEDMAAAINTIAYEIFTGITERVVRIYK